MFSGALMRDSWRFVNLDLFRGAVSGNRAGGSLPIQASARMPEQRGCVVAHGFVRFHRLKWGEIWETRYSRIGG